MRSKVYSTFELLPPDEYAEGLARAEAEHPEQLGTGSLARRRRQRSHSAYPTARRNPDGIQHRRRRR